MCGQREFLFTLRISVTQNSSGYPGKRFVMLLNSAFYRAPRNDLSHCVTKVICNNILIKSYPPVPPSQFLHVYWNFIVTIHLCLYSLNCANAWRAEAGPVTWRHQILHAHLALGSQSVSSRSARLAFHFNPSLPPLSTHREEHHHLSLLS